MQTQTTQTQTAPLTERVFDETGQTIEETQAAPTPVSTPEVPIEEPALEQAQTPQAAPVKYRIGDREFATQDEALAYADSQMQVTDAYQQGLRDAAYSQPTQSQSVTPQPQAAPDLDPQELYTNPQEFLRKYGQNIKGQTVAEIQQQNALRDQSDQIWREFSHRHPELADFRTEVENFVHGNQRDVRGIITTKGRDASYDFIALKLKSKFESYANAVKPQRALPNSGSTVTPTTKATSVTPKAPENKPLSFSEQIRKIKAQR